MKPESEQEYTSLAAPDAENPAEPRSEETAPPETAEIVGVRFRDGGKIYYFSPGANTVKERVALMGDVRNLVFFVCHNLLLCFCQLALTQ